MVMFEKLLTSQKFGVLFAAVILALLMHYLGMDNQIILLTTIGPAAVFCISQGVADIGKSRAAIEVQGQVEAAKVGAVAHLATVAANNPNAAASIERAQKEILSTEK